MSLDSKQRINFRGDKERLAACHVLAYTPEDIPEADAEEQMPGSARNLGVLFGLAKGGGPRRARASTGHSGG